MASKRFYRFAHRVEKWIDTLKPQRAVGQLMIEPYIGYATPDGLVVRGRVLEESSADALNNLVSGLGSFGLMLSNFLTDEVANVEIQAGDHKTTSDEEGYFSLHIDPSAEQDGMVPVTLPATGGAFELPVQTVPGAATHGIISDIDDTIIETGAWLLAKNLWTTFTTPAKDRVIFGDTVELIEKLQGEDNPVFFVSSSPWNLHQYLLDLFHRGKVPPGPIFLRDLGIDDNKFIKSSHGSHKGDAIDIILAANPTLDFHLIGDTGQHDGQVYLDAIKRHPGRIQSVYLRGAGKPDEEDKRIAEAIEATGTQFFSAPTFQAAL